MQKLMVVGDLGNNGFSAEIVDLSKNVSVCPFVSNFPREYGSVGGYVNGKILVCGGGSPGPTSTTSCWVYNATANGWNFDVSMITPRIDHAAVILNNGDWWVSGSYQTVTSTEIYSRGSFSSYEPLPIGRYHHTMLTLDDNRVVLSGNGDTTSLNYVFEFSTETWTELPPQPQGKADGAAGILKYGNGSFELVVTGGERSKLTYIYSFHNDEWRDGPELPVFFELEDAISVPYGDSFLLVGGLDSSVFRTSIIKYDIDTQNWETLPQTLTLGRFSHAAFLIPDDTVECL